MVKGEEKEWDIAFMFIGAGCAEDDKAFGAVGGGELGGCFEEGAHCVCAKGWIRPGRFEPC